MYENCVIWYHDVDNYYILKAMYKIVTMCYTITIAANI